MKVLCITGKAEHGKDTLATLLREAYEAQGKSVLITHFADLVKYICKTFLDWNGEKDEYGRTLLQTVGTEIFRTYRADFWVGFIIDVLSNYKNKWDCVIIPDWRFPNEAGELERAGFDVLRLRVVRTDAATELLTEQQNHSSEISLDGYEVDYTFLNDSDLASLSEKVDSFVNS